MATEEALSEPAKLLLLSSLLAKDGIITHNGKALLKELVLRGDSRLHSLLTAFETRSEQDTAFLDTISELVEGEAQRLHADIFAECSLDIGKALSKAEREKMGLSEKKSLIYGEVDFLSFSRVLRKINPGQDLTFYDLGSGTGKALLVARIMHDFRKCEGIEILSGLHNAAELVVNRFNQSFRSNLSTLHPQQVGVHHASLLTHDWSDGDVIFANSTCFDDDLMESLATQASKLKPGAHVITFTKGLNSPAFEVLERKRYKMSWGPATVFIHRRLQPDGSPGPGVPLRDIPDDVSFQDFDEDDDGESDDDDESEDESEDDEEDDDYDDDYQYGRGYPSAQ